MWEEAIPTPPAEEQTPPPPKTPPRSQKDLVLWTQLILCALILAGMLAARALQLPLFARLRVGYTAALSAGENDPFFGERQFVRFVQETWAVFEQAAREVLGQLRPDDAETGNAVPAVADPLSAGRPRHGKEAPAGSSLLTYLPDFVIAHPLGGRWYTLTSGYGWRTDPITGKKGNFHHGLDLAQAEGTPVTAAATGVVRSAGHSGSYGNYVRILHPGGDETLYAHMQYLFVHAGQNIELGQTIGTVGQTGNATGPHLHFEILHQGVRYDPTEALQAVP